eukprot:TRINITY_DN504_c0_g2_i3.p1 TRINITY_DN504_c0_g2~~TRINITY_DN504_c0_g2_i3.p1  ORF type:complete len:119 (-),score=10.47 TRINITY_DN504_c0_g2_i3:747-1103(-)
MTGISNITFAIPSLSSMALATNTTNTNPSVINMTTTFSTFSPSFITGSKALAPSSDISNVLLAILSQTAMRNQVPMSDGTDFVQAKKEFDLILKMLLSCKFEMKITILILSKLGWIIP